MFSKNLCDMLLDLLIALLLFCVNRLCNKFFRGIDIPIMFAASRQLNTLKIVHLNIHNSSPIISVEFYVCRSVEMNVKC